MHKLFHPGRNDHTVRLVENKSNIKLQVVRAVHGVMQMTSASVTLLQIGALFRVA